VIYRKEVEMTDKIPVFDSWGNQVGDFIPSGSSGLQVIGLPVAGPGVFLFYCLPIVVILAVLAAPFATLIWVITRPEDYPNRKTFIFLSISLIVAEICGGIFLISAILFCNPSSTFNLCV